MRRSSGKKRAPKTKMRKKPMRKKTTKKGKNPWLEHAGKVFAELRKKDPKISYKQAMIEAKKTYKKGQKADSWNVSSSKYSTVSKKKNNDSWNVSTSKYSTVGKKGKKKKGKSRRRRSRRRVGGDIPEGQCGGPQ